MIPVAPAQPSAAQQFGPPVRVWESLPERQKLALQGVVSLEGDLELVRGWPRIAQVIGFSVKSAKLFEHTAHLPVFRNDYKQGDQCRVFSVLSMLLRWVEWRRRSSLGASQGP